MTDPLDVTAGRAPWAVCATDALAGLRLLPDACVQCCVTSPPYFALRSYLKKGDPLKALEMGGERAVDCFGWATGSRCRECFVCRMTAVFEEVRRVLRPDGTLWCNISGSYASSGVCGGGSPLDARTDGKSNKRNPTRESVREVQQQMRGNKTGGGVKRFRLRSDLTPEQVAYVLSELAKARRT